MKRTARASVAVGAFLTTLRWTGIDFMLDEVTTIAYVFDAAQPTPNPDRCC
jgi:hypothetical protein